jgi:hypothetical protein
MHLRPILAVLAFATAVPAVLSAQEVDPAVVRRTYLALSDSFPSREVEVQIGQLRREHTLGAIVKLGLDSLAFQADSSTLSTAASAVARFVYGVVPLSTGIQVVVVYWTWSPRPGQKLVSPPFRFDAAGLAAHGEQRIQ